MEKRLNLLFRNAKYNPNADLHSDIWRLITLKQNKQLRLKLYTSVTMNVVSLAALVYALKDLINQFSQSGFYSYISLVLSDTGSISSIWKEYVLSLASSLPVASLTISLVVIAVFLVSARSTIRQASNKLSIA